MLVLKSVIFYLLLFLQLGCNGQTTIKDGESIIVDEKDATKIIASTDTSFKTIHVFVALCDNKFQGIVPVPSIIGNGQDPDNNLYWGCGLGIRTYFRKSVEWKQVKFQKIDSLKLEKIVFKHATKNWYLIAEAYNGKYIETCTKDFLKSSAGIQKDTIHVNNKVIGTHGNASLLAYIGHDGLMDFQLTESFVNKDGIKRNCIILACYSRSYFSPHLKNANVIPLVWTTGLMCPEAYTLHDAISGFINKKSNEEIRTMSAKAYSKYQKCSEKSAKTLLVTGW